MAKGKRRDRSGSSDASWGHTENAGRIADRAREDRLRRLQQLDKLRVARAGRVEALQERLRLGRAREVKSPRPVEGAPKVRAEVQVPRRAERGEGSRGVRQTLSAFGGCIARPRGGSGSGKGRKFLPFCEVRR